LTVHEILSNWQLILGNTEFYERPEIFYSIARDMLDVIGSQASTETLTDEIQQLASLMKIICYHSQELAFIDDQLPAMFSRPLSFVQLFLQRIPIKPKRGPKLYKILHELLECEE